VTRATRVDVAAMSAHRRSFVAKIAELQSQHPCQTEHDHGYYCYPRLAVRDVHEAYRLKQLGEQSRGL
jgi:hypothetical protein